MRTVPVSAERSYQVEIGINWRSSLLDWCEGRSKTLIISSVGFPTADQIAQLKKMPESQSEIYYLEIPDSEAGKSVETLQAVWEKLSSIGLSKDDLIVGIGGGAVTDVSGFAAATWLRGIDWIAIPTTLAGMVDAAIGGKTGVNAQVGKNLIGAFHSPISVLIDQAWLETLTPRDMAAGMAEVIKCGYIMDIEILNLVRGKTLENVIADEDLQIELIHRAVSVKSNVVSADFKESFLREVLNYGHTVGHAIEKHSGYTLRHGECVAIGMCFAAELSRQINGLSDLVVQNHYEILKAMRLPTSYEISAWPEIEKLLWLDKKNRSGVLRFVGLLDVGKCNRIENPDSSALNRAYEMITR